LPSLFETSLGTMSLSPGRGLKPERSNSWEFGASTVRGNLLADGDTVAAKLVYFNNNFKHYIVRYYDYDGVEALTEKALQMRNTDRYKTSGL
ncbi:TonB-dependent receptor, partial [Salmonella enterica]|nr:TonB-dependent receptor [Salmonella enterica]